MESFKSLEDVEINGDLIGKFKENKRKLLEMYSQFGEIVKKEDGSFFVELMKKIIKEMYACLAKCKEKQILIDIREELRKNKMKVKDNCNLLVSNISDAKKYFMKETEEIFCNKEMEN